MRAIILRQEELQQLYQQYLNDPLRNNLIKQKIAILEVAIPTHMVNHKTGETITIYDTKTKELLSKIDCQLKKIDDIYRSKLEI